MPLTAAEDQFIISYFTVTVYMYMWSHYTTGLIRSSGSRHSAPSALQKLR